MGFLEALTIVFIILKILEIINFNWFIVFLPLIISIIVYTFCFTFGIGFFKKFVG